MFQHEQNRSGETRAAKGGDQKNDPEALRLKLAELKVPLAPYLKQISNKQSNEEAFADNTLKKFAADKYDLRIDKIFGDNHILFRSSIAVPDVTHEVIDFVSTLNETR